MGKEEGQPSCGNLPTSFGSGVDVKCYITNGECPALRPGYSETERYEKCARAMAAEFTDSIGEGLAHTIGDDEWIDYTVKRNPDDDGDEWQE